MISMFLNCAKVWTRIVRVTYRIGRRPAVRLSRDPIPVHAARQG